MRREDVLGLPRVELARLLREGQAIDPAALDDMEYRGISLGLGAFIERLTWKTFQKTFHRDRDTGALRGWNVRLEQRGLDAASVALRKHDEPFTFGHYQVVPSTGAPIPVEGGTLRGLYIDYRLGGNSAFDPMRFVIDPIVALNEGSSELLLGWSYVELGFVRLGTPAFFLLERERPLTHIAQQAARRRALGT